MSQMPVRWGSAGAEAAAWARPDGVWAVKLPHDVSMWRILLATRPAVVDRLIVRASADDPPTVDALRGAGLFPMRREHEWRIPLAAVRLPRVSSPRHRLVSIVDCDLERVLWLDDEIRGVIPGTEQWRGSLEALEETLRDDEFDPSLYRIAVRDDGAYDGLIRVWWRTPTPRLGCVGVTAQWRRTRLPGVLLGDMRRRLVDRGVEGIVTETDETNRGSHPLAVRWGEAARVMTEWRGGPAPHEATTRA